MWGEHVDIDDMEQILNKDKLFLLDACAPPVTVAVTVSRDAGMKVGKRGGGCRRQGQLWSYELHL